MMRLLSIMLVLIVGVAAQAQPRGTQDFEPSAWRNELAGAPSPVVTIGSFHLSQVTTLNDRAMLDPLLARLAAFRPDIITHERLSGEQCAQLRAMPITHWQAGEKFCWDPLDIGAATGMTAYQAQERLFTTLLAFPAQPTAPQRRDLARLFLAAHDRASAVVQWMQLPPAERVAADGLTPAMVDHLNTVMWRRVESYSIAAELAARLGHVRVYAVDDHSSDSVMAMMPVACDAELRGMYQTAAVTAGDQRIAQMLAQLTDGPAILQQYRQLNQPAALSHLVNAAQRSALNGAGDCGRRYYAHLDTRNLRMVANIRAIIGTRPGARVMNIVGAMHKPFYDLYLGQSPDVQVVDAATVLGTD